MSRACDHRDCANEAWGQPVVTLRATLVDAGMEFRYGVNVCLVHAETLTVDQLVGEEGWQVLEQAFRIVQGLPPSRKLATIRVDPELRSPVR